VHAQHETEQLKIDNTAFGNLNVIAILKLTALRKSKQMQYGEYVTNWD